MVMVVGVGEEGAGGVFGIDSRLKLFLELDKFTRCDGL